MLRAKQNNWLAAVLLENNPKTNIINWSLAKIDVSTGEFLVQAGEDTNNYSRINQTKSSRSDI